MGHGLIVVLPEHVQLRGKGEGEVEVVGGEKLVAFVVEPLLDLDEGALRAGAVPARVVPDFLDVPEGAALDVAAEGGGATQSDGLGRLVEEQRQQVSLEVAGQAGLEDGAEGELAVHIRVKT